jgi:hypothetical protein
MAQKCNLGNRKRALGRFDNELIGAQDVKHLCKVINMGLHAATINKNIIKKITTNLHNNWRKTSFIKA